MKVWIDERFEVFLEYLDAYRTHLQATENNIEKRHELLRDVVSKVKIQVKFEFPKIVKQEQAEQKGT